MLHHDMAEKGLQLETSTTISLCHKGKGEIESMTSFLSLSISRWSLEMGHRMGKQTPSHPSAPHWPTGEFPPHFKCENIFNLKWVSRTHHVRTFMPHEMWLLCHLLPDSGHGSFHGFRDRQIHLTSQTVKLQRRISSEFLLALPRNPQSSEAEGLLICANNQSSNFLSIPLNEKLHQTFQT